MVLSRYGDGALEGFYKVARDDGAIAVNKTDGAARSRNALLRGSVSFVGHASKPSRLALSTLKDIGAWYGLPVTVDYSDRWDSDG